jgi:hypothetical protein
MKPDVSVNALRPMDKELIDYIITHYYWLFSPKEIAAQRHHLMTLKTGSSDFKHMILAKWGTKDPETLDLLNNGYEEFKRITADKIIRQHREKVSINNCPKCGRLARTPLARQCRHCGHDWH